MHVAPTILRQHAQLAAFLWAQHDTLAALDPPEPATLAGIRARLAANLDALAIAGPAAWPFVAEQVQDYPEKGELFVAAHHAIGLGDREHLEAFATRAEEAGESRGVAGALAAHASAAVAPVVRDWLHAPGGFRRALATGALLAHEADARHWLPRLLADPDPRVRRPAYRLASANRRADCLDALRNGLKDADAEARAEAAWACAELGDVRVALPVLKATAEQMAPVASPVLRIALTVALGPLSSADRRAWLGGLHADPRTRPLAVRLAPLLGGAELLPWLVRCMEEAPLAVAAGAAFLEIHGPVEDMTDHFYPYPDAATEAFGPEAIFGDGRIPIAERFRKFCEGRLGASDN